MRREFQTEAAERREFETSLLKAVEDIRKENVEGLAHIAEILERKL